MHARGQTTPHSARRVQTGSRGALFKTRSGVRWGFWFLALGLSIELGAGEGNELPAGEEIARRINGREDGSQLRQRMRMELRSPQGQERIRDALVLRLDQPAVRHGLVVFREPSTIEGTAFLTQDHEDASRVDDQWLFLPAFGRTRRISSANRGDNFFGTDFTYEDMQESLRFAEEDYRFVTVARQGLGDVPVLVVDAFPHDERIADELGYGRIRIWVEEATWLPLRAHYWNPQGRPLKQVDVIRRELIDGVWTPLEIVAVDSESGHRTRLTFSEIDYTTTLEPALFSERTLRRGL